MENSIIGIIVLIVLSVLVFYRIYYNNKQISDKINHLSAENHTLKKNIKQKQEQIEALIESNTNLISENKELLRELSFYSEIDYESIKFGNGKETDNDLINQYEPQSHSQSYESNAFSNSANFKHSSDEVNEKDSYLTVLDEEQRKAFDLMEKTNNNLFITGRAGTGKSFLLKAFSWNTKKKVLLLAPTGIAALNIQGSTIHSVFGFNHLEQMQVDDLNEDTIKMKSEMQLVLTSTDVIVIDEISMVRADVFDKIDKILRIVCKNSLPFAGKQVIVFGDLFQLPPIVNKTNKHLLSGYSGKYFFYSRIFQAAYFRCIELLENHRQSKDMFYFYLLNRIRTGTMSHDDILELNNRVVQEDQLKNRIITVFPKKADAEYLNRKKLKEIKGKEYTYYAKVTVDEHNIGNSIIDTSFPISKELKLKVGALVMMVKNDPGKKWVNGTMGIVKKLTTDSIFVSISGNTYQVFVEKFQQQEPVFLEGRIQYKDVYVVEQFPLVLAYAMTIHKSQGQTFSEVACDISGCFDSGQAYVALSRCEALSGLYLLSRVGSADIKTDYSIVDFYSNYFELKSENLPF